MADMVLNDLITIVASQGNLRDHHFKVRNPVTFTTGSTTFQLILTHTWTPKADTAYVIFWSCATKNLDSNGTGPEIEIREDGSVRARQQNRYGQSTNKTYVDGGMIFLDADPSPSSIDWTMYGRSDFSTFDIEFTDASFFAMELLPGLNNDVRDDLGAPATTTSSSYVDGLSFVFKPFTAGDYLVLFCCELENDTATFASGCHAVIDGTIRGQYEPEREQNNYEKVYLYVEKRNFNTGLHTLKFEFAAPEGGITTIRRQRILCLRLDRFGHYLHDQALTQGNGQPGSFTDHLDTGNWVFEPFPYFLLMRSITGGADPNFGTQRFRFREDDVVLGTYDPNVIKHPEGSGATRDGNMVYFKMVNDGGQHSYDAQYLNSTPDNVYMDDTSITALQMTVVGEGSFAQTIGDKIPLCIGGPRNAAPLFM